MSGQLTTAEHRLLWQLVANPGGEFESVLKPTNAKRTREALVAAKLIVVEKRVRPSRSKRKVKSTYLSLTDAGWAWCNQNMAWHKPKGKAERFLNALLQRLRVLFERQTAVASLADFIVTSAPDATPAPAPAAANAPVPVTGLGARIRAACLELGGGREAVRVRLADLRRKLADVPPDELTAAVRDLSRRGELTLSTLDDPRQVTPTDVAAAILTTTGVAQHIIYYGGIHS